MRRPMVFTPLVCRLCRFSLIALRMPSPANVQGLWQCAVRVR